jgi:hypothetical protein
MEQGAWGKKCLKCLKTLNLYAHYEDIIDLEVVAHPVGEGLMEDVFLFRHRFGVDV